MGRKKDIESIGQVYAQSKSTENYYLFLTFRHSRDNAGPNEFRLRKESELTSKDRNQFKHMKEYSSSMNDTHPDAKTYSNDLGTFPFRICVVGPEKALKQLLGDFIKNFNGELYPEKEIMNRKTEEIFGDIIYNESSDEDEYILFVGLYKSSGKSKGILKKVSDMTGDERKLSTMMSRYDVVPQDKNIKAYELKGPFGPYTLQMAFVGDYGSVMSYAEEYKRWYGKNFNLINRVPMKKGTKKHFKNII